MFVHTQVHQKNEAAKDECRQKETLASQFLESRQWIFDGEYEDESKVRVYVGTAATPRATLASLRPKHGEGSNNSLQYPHKPKTFRLDYPHEITIGNGIEVATYSPDKLLLTSSDRDGQRKNVHKIVAIKHGTSGPWRAVSKHFNHGDVWLTMGAAQEGTQRFNDDKSFYYRNVKRSLVEPTM